MSLACREALLRQVINVEQPLRLLNDGPDSQSAAVDLFSGAIIEINEQ